MSNSVLTKFFEGSRSRGNARLCGLALADRASEEGVAWCGADDIAWRAGIGEQNVPRAIRELEQIGELVVERRAGPKFTNLYRFTDSIMVSPLRVRPPQPDTLSPRVPDPLRVRSRPSQGETRTQGNPKEPKRGRTQPPKLEDVVAYAAEIGMTQKSASRFHDHFTSNGWKVGGRTPMKDWRASLRLWHARDQERAATKPAEHEDPIRKHWGRTNGRVVL